MNRVMIQEYIPLGQRVKSFVVEYKKGDQWLSVKCNEETTTVGYKRLLRFEMIETEELRIRMLVHVCVSMRSGLITLPMQRKIIHRQPQN